jgi:hypothetical protein
MEGIPRRSPEGDQDMTTHRLPVALACAWCLVLASIQGVMAQFPPPPGQSAAAGQSNPFPPAPGQGGGGGFGAPAGGGFGPPPGGASPFGPPGGGPPPNQQVCATFPPLRAEAEQRAMAIKAAGERKAPRDQVCKLFNSFVAIESKMVKFLVDHRQTCGIPPDAVSGAKANHAKTLEIRKTVCATGPVVTGPSLSDALGGPIIADDNSAKQPGRGTFDTLTGNALSR